jgi:hypothetical protein
LGPATPALPSSNGAVIEPPSVNRDELIVAAFAAVVMLMGFWCGWYSRVVWVLNPCGVHTL